MTPGKRWHPTNGLVVPNAAALLHTNPFYLVAPRFVGPQGPLTTRQAQLVVVLMQEHTRRLPIFFSGIWLSSRRNCSLG